MKDFWAKRCSLVRMRIISAVFVRMRIISFCTFLTPLPRRWVASLELWFFPRQREMRRSPQLRRHSLEVCSKDPLLLRRRGRGGRGSSGVVVGAHSLVVPWVVVFMFLTVTSALICRMWTAYAFSVFKHVLGLRLILPSAYWLMSDH